MLPSSENRAWSYLEERFGIQEEDLKRFQLKEVSGDIWIVSRQTETELEVETYGVRFIRVMDIGLKPTTYGLQLLGDRIEKNVVKLDKDEMEKLLRREEMVERKMDDKGYVALRFEDRIIGCGFYKDDKVSSRIPKGRGKELLDILSQRTA